jgi:hypothetical protein
MKNVLKCVFGLLQRCVIEKICFDFDYDWVIKKISKTDLFSKKTDYDYDYSEKNRNRLPNRLPIEGDYTSLDY